MALKMTILSEKKTNDLLEEKRVLLKALPEADRAASQELIDFKLVEKKIKLRIFNPFGSTTDAYLKIDKLEIDKNSFRINLNVYLNEGAREEEAQFINNLNIEIPFSEVPSGDPIANAYSEIKKIDIFSDAVDV